MLTGFRRLHYRVPPKGGRARALRRARFLPRPTGRTYTTTTFPRIEGASTDTVTDVIWDGNDDKTIVKKVAPLRVACCRFRPWTRSLSQRRIANTEQWSGE